MGGGFGVADESFHAAEGDGVVGEFKGAEEFEGGGFAAVEVEGDHGAGVVGLGEADADLFGVIEKGGVEDFADLGTADEGFGDALGVFALAVHAKGDSGEASVEDPAFIGLEDIPEEAAVCADGAFEIGVGAEDDAGEEVGEAAEVFGGGVDDEVGAEDHRVLEGGAEEGVIDHDGGAGVDLAGG